MSNTFSNPTLMAKVKAELLEIAAKSESYCDPMFGTLFTDIVKSTEEIVPRFSCQGHWVKEIAADNGDIIEFVNLDTYDGGDSISSPYISFLCTRKGKLILDHMFERIISKAKQEDYELWYFKMDIDYFGGPDISKEEETFRVTLTVDGGWALSDEKLHTDVIGIIKDSIREVMDERRYPRR